MPVNIYGPFYKYLIYHGLENSRSSFLLDFSSLSTFYSSLSTFYSSFSTIFSSLSTFILNL